MMFAIVSANLGAIDPEHPWAPQEVPGLSVVTYRLTDATFPPRTSVSPRLWAKVPKFFAWQLFPGCDYYLWVDGSFELLAGAGAWCLDHLGDAEIALFRHPSRRTIRQESEYLQKKVAQNHSYLTPRYAGERLDEAYLAVVDGYVDDSLYASGVLVYRPTPAVQAMFKDWWYYVSRYHVNDQVSLPRVLRQAGCRVGLLPGSVYQSPHIIWRGHV